MLFMSCRDFQLTHTVSEFNVSIFSLIKPPVTNRNTVSWALLQGIFPTQGLNPGLPPCRRILYQLSHQGSPRTLEWVAYPFCRGSSQSRDQTQVSCIAGRFFTI